MGARFSLVREPARIAAHGGKLIEEVVGRVCTGSEDVSVAHMVAPPGWDEPPQTPEFSETTVMMRGRMRAELGPAGSAETIEVGAGETLRVEAGVRVRYANPFAEEAEYYAVCVPAFSLDKAHRE